MAGWELTQGLTNLRNQVNKRWPNRDKGSDGTIGDTAHQATTSGHNRDDTAGSKPAWNADGDTKPEVRAFDCDVDFRDPTVTPQQVVDHIRKLPGVASVLRYIIYNRKLYHARDGFAPTPYAGSNPHDQHIHFEGAWTQAADNNTTFNFRLDEVGTMALADDQIVLTEDTAKEIGKKKGDKVSAATLLQLTVIHAARSSDKAAAAYVTASSVKETVGNVVARLTELESWFGRLGDQSSAADTAVALRTILGPRAAEVGRLLATQPPA